MSQMFLESVSILLVPWFLCADRLYDPSPVKVPKLHDLCAENILEGRKRIICTLDFLDSF